MVLVHSRMHCRKRSALGAASPQSREAAYPGYDQDVVIVPRQRAFVQFTEQAQGQEEEG